MIRPFLTVGRTICNTWRTDHALRGYSAGGLGPRDQPDAPALSARRYWRAWRQACRPPFFITAAIPVTLALAFAFRQQGGISTRQWGVYGLLLAGCFLGLTIANFANDLFDHILGVDGGENIGGSRVIQSGLISPRALSTALLLLIPATVAVGAALIAGTLPQLRPGLWLVTLFAVASAVFYVAPPVRYGSRSGRAFRLPEHGPYYGFLQAQPASGAF